MTYDDDVITRLTRDR